MYRPSPYAVNLGIPVYVDFSLVNKYLDHTTCLVMRAPPYSSPTEFCITQNSPNFGKANIFVLPTRSRVTIIKYNIYNIN